MNPEEFDIEGFGSIKKTTWADIIPQEGVFLGLDISKDSTGICLIEDGVKTTANIILTSEQLEIQKSDKRNFEEVLLRRQLKKDLSEMIRDKHFDLIIIEDVFAGDNPKVVRLLYSLNTAIDELILDGVCDCKDFIRINNGEWKKWLWSGIDPMQQYKGYNVKLRIRQCLTDIEIDEGNEHGSQDRLDATGMLIGYFLWRGEELNKELEKKSRSKITWSHIDIAYELDESFIFDDNPWLRELEIKYIDMQRITKKAILDRIRMKPECMYILLEEKVKLGFVGKELGLKAISTGGCFAFWLKKSARRRFLESN